MEERIALIKKYGVLGSMIVLLPFIEPYLTKYISDAATKKFSNIVKKEIYECSSKDNKLETEVIHKVAKTIVAHQSVHKVEAIRKILNTFPRIRGNEHRIKLAIRNELIMQSGLYIRFLNKFAPHPKIGYIGDYIKNNFDMDSFLENVYTLALAEFEMEGYDKCDDIMQYMLSVQEDFFDKMLMEMK